MDFFTLTDHDTIEGCLAVADRPGVFLSEEITAIFPDEDCAIHVLAWNITPDHHVAIQERRRNVYHLVDYLCEQGIAHAAAHPLLSPTWNLTSDTLEKLLLIFPVLERVNGLLDARICGDFEHLVEHVDGKLLRSWAQKHGLSIRGNLNGRKAFTGGSDDHTSRRAGRMYTESSRSASTPVEFLNEVMSGRCKAVGDHASLEDMASTIQRTSYEHLRRRGIEAARADLFVDLIDVVMGRQLGPHQGSAAQSFRAAARRHLSNMEWSGAVSTPSDSIAEVEAVDRAQQISDGFLSQAVRGLLTAVPAFDLCGMFNAAEAAMDALIAAGPLLGAADHFGRQAQQVRRIWAGWSSCASPPAQTVTALISDSMGHQDGVSTWCDRFIAQSTHAGEGLVVPVVDLAACGGRQTDPYRTIPAVASYALPFYSTFKLHLPSLMAMVRMFWRDRVTRVEIATPGPMGLVGSLAARLLRLPVTATFHTDVVALAEILGGDPFPLATLRRYSRWFYNQVDRVRVFTPPGRDALRCLGVPEARIDLAVPQIDPDDFSPTHRDPGIFERLGVARTGRPVVLSVGRLSREKELPTIIEAVRRLQTRIRPPPILVIAGDGPERSRLEGFTSSEGFVFFVGHQEGTGLRQLFASAQVFAFASRLDTLGLVNFEALASGLPLVVPRDSNIASLLQHDRDAYCYPPGPNGLEEALATLLQDRERSARLSVAGRRFVAGYSGMGPAVRIATNV
jgi:glycosyltransferase involved in cell wall biosynthesis